MKIIFTLLLVALSLVSGQAQDYTVSPTNTDTVTAPYNTLTIFDIYQVNNASVPILLKWEKVSVSLPVGWDYSLCDYGHCYTGIPTGGTMDSVNAGSMGLLGLNINPYSVPGQGIVKLYVYQDGYYASGDTITWVVNTSPVSTTDLSDRDVIRLYPNPASDYISVLNMLTDDGKSDVFFYDVAGHVVQVFPGFSSKSIDVSGFQRGMYFVEIRSGGNRLTVVKLEIR